MKLLPRVFTGLLSSDDKDFTCIAIVPILGKVWGISPRSRMELTHDTGPQSWNECCRVTWDLHFPVFYTAHLIGEDTHAELDMHKR